MGKKKLKKLVKKLRAERHGAWVEGIRVGFDAGRDAGGRAVSVDLAGKVVLPITHSALYLIEHGLEDYAHVLLRALHDKSAEIAGRDDDDEGEGCEECACEPPCDEGADDALVCGATPDEIARTLLRTLGFPVDEDESIVNAAHDEDCPL